ncbi:hypothetical protein [Phycicoccus sp. Root101]|uniref:hypothetical protein n=1 Tax=Phycicoccus sp. Root101 TaxID=1736421 RepID=UPI000702ECAE|nr:hypothetical protein [Phycicoccus sp. Root101]KQU67579.1 hypothetical protein ASC58_13655 [Phycicoccus sp. Root101]
MADMANIPKAIEDCGQLIGGFVDWLEDRKLRRTVREAHERDRSATEQEEEVDPGAGTTEHDSASPARKADS